MNSPYILYGSYASYYTAKVRAFLRKKGIPFVERLPSSARFREYVRPTSGSHRIPQLEAPDGTVIQDSVAIFDYLEARHPELPSIPETPRQRLAVHLLELFGSEGLVRLAWQFRWFFPEENDFFVKMDFGRSFRPQGSDDELMHYGNLIAERMLSRGALDTSEAVKEAMRADYVALLQRLEAHFTEHPYLLGGHPSNADYSLMGALHAHMGRDPLPLSIMQSHAPRVFRWVEHMLVPEVQSPEFFETPIAYPANDEIPETLSALLKHLSAAYGEQFEQNALAWAEQANVRQNEPAGEPIAGAGEQPALPPIQIDWHGEPRDVGCNLYHAWVSQRAQRYYQSLDKDDQTACDGLLDECALASFVRIEPVRWLERQDNRLVLGELC